MSIPDEVFEDAERLARRLKRSRSEVYSRALAEYVARHAPDQVTEQMDRVVEELAEPADPVRLRGRPPRVEAKRVVTVSQGDICWAALGEPTGSEPAFRRPVVVVQGDPLNLSRIATVVCVALTSNMKWSEAPGNVALSSATTGLPKDSVANVAQLVTIDKAALSERVGKLPRAKLQLVLSGIDVVLDR